MRQHKGKPIIVAIRAGEETAREPKRIEHRRPANKWFAGVVKGIGSGVRRKQVTEVTAPGKSVGHTKYKV